MPRTDAGGSGGRSPQARHVVQRQIYLFRGGSRKAQAVTAGKGKPMPENYRMQMERVLKENSARRPRLLLHSCCGPCSSAVLEALCPHFEVTVDYYNPNIDTAEEYAHRAAEQARFTAAAPFAAGTQVLVAPYEPQAFYAAVKGLEHIPEGGARCFACYALRLRHAAALAKQLSCEYFCTTLSVSPHKNAAKLNELGCAIAEEYSVKWLPSDFKKADGFRRSTALSAEYGMYRQDYCGCVFSKREAEARRAARAPAL